MKLSEEWVRYGEEHQYTGFAVRPERAVEALPTVVVIQEIWGVDVHIEDVARRFAEAGYLAFAPDLYAKGGERPAVYARDRIDAVKKFLDSVPPSVWHSDEQRKEALANLPEAQSRAISETFGALFGGLKMELYTDQLVATTAFLRDMYPASRGQKVGSVGFCMGGALSALLASMDPALAGSVVFYGSSLAADAVARVQCPIVGFYGSLDQRITDTVPTLETAMNQAGKSFVAHVYEGAQHAFFNDTRASYHVSAARDAWARTLLFFSQQLQP